MMMLHGLGQRPADEEHEQGREEAREERGDPGDEDNSGLEDGRRAFHKIADLL